MLKSRRGIVLLAGTLLLIALGSACNEKSPTGDYCDENPENCTGE